MTKNINPGTPRPKLIVNNTAPDTPSKAFWKLRERYEDAILRGNLSPAEKLVGAAMVRHANLNHYLETGQIASWLSLRGIAERTGLSERFVKRLRSRLRAAGVFTGTSKGGRRRKGKDQPPTSVFAVFSPSILERWSAERGNDRPPLKRERPAPLSQPKRGNVRPPESLEERTLDPVLTKPAQGAGPRFRASQEGKSPRADPPSRPRSGAALANWKKRQAAHLRQEWKAAGRSDEQIDHAVSTLGYEPDPISKRVEAYEAAPPPSDASFDRFVGGYPDGGDPEPSLTVRAAWDRAIERDVNPEDILQGLADYRERLPRDPRKYHRKVEFLEAELWRVYKDEGDDARYADAHTPKPQAQPKPNGHDLRPDRRVVRPVVSARSRWDREAEEHKARLAAEHPNYKPRYSNKR